ncbi:sulfatase [Candidatus Poribacteria bacterium]|nr:sulfatase [Candidatus Poribacteria bacterium]
MERKPNLVFVFGDQHRQCDVGCADNPQVQTPAMDQLAQEGMYFPNTFTNVPICVPARGCLMTGKYPLNHKAVSNDLPLPLSETGIAEIFKDDGYATGYIGKWHLGGVPRNKTITPEMRFGFDHWVGWNCHHNYFNAPYHDSDGNQFKIEGYEPDFQTDKAIEFFKDYADDPFCLYLSWGPPHNPYEHVPEHYKEMYPPDEIQLRPNAVDTPNTRRDLSGYYSHITALDENLGKLMSALDEIGIAEDTILVYTSDHGDMIGSHGHVRKERPWDESSRIPFMIRYPKRIPAGVTRETLLSLVDFMPSMLSLCGLSIPDGVEGIDLSDAMLGQTIDEPESVFLGVPLHGGEGNNWGLKEWRGIRTHQHTYARQYDGTGWLLYDNDADPYQMNNLIDDSDSQTIRKELESELQKWLTRTNDPFLPGLDHIRELGLADLWNTSEEFLGGKNPRIA